RVRRFRGPAATPPDHLRADAATGHRAPGTPDRGTPTAGRNRGHDASRASDPSRTFATASLRHRHAGDGLGRLYPEQPAASHHLDAARWSAAECGRDAAHGHEPRRPVADAGFTE